MPEPSLDVKTVDSKLSSLHPDMRVRLIRTMNDMQSIHKMKIRITETIRTHQRQDYLYSLGRTIANPNASPGMVVTHARAGESMHQYGLAADCCFDGSDPYLAKHINALFLWSELGRIGKDHGLEWGGDFSKPDKPHLQKSYGLNIEELKKIYAFGQIPGVWVKIDQIIGMVPGTNWKLDKLKTNGTLH